MSYRPKCSRCIKKKCFLVDSAQLPHSLSTSLLGIMFVVACSFISMANVIRILSTRGREKETSGLSSESDGGRSRHRHVILALVSNSRCVHLTSPATAHNSNLVLRFAAASLIRVNTNKQYGHEARQDTLNSYDIATSRQSRSRTL